MTEAFEKWFKETFDNPMYSEEEKESLKLYTWLAWRDSRRNLDDK